MTKLHCTFCEHDIFLLLDSKLYCAVCGATAAESQAQEPARYRRLEAWYEPDEISLKNQKS